MHDCWVWEKNWVIQTENALYQELAQYLTLRYPRVIYHFDLSGMWTPSHAARNLYGSLNRRAWPDLFIAAAVTSPARYHGLFVELKREGARLKKRNGAWATSHIAEQAAMLIQLQAQGYIAQFATGLAEAIDIIDSYLSAAGHALPLGLDLTEYPGGYPLDALPF